MLDRDKKLMNAAGAFVGMLDHSNGAHLVFSCNSTGEGVWRGLAASQVEAYTLSNRSCEMPHARRLQPSKIGKLRSNSKMPRSACTPTSENPDTSFSGRAVPWLCGKPRQVTLGPCINRQASA